MFGRTADKIKHSWAGGNGRMVASSDVVRWSGSGGLLSSLNTTEWLHSAKLRETSNNGYHSFNIQLETQLK